MRIVKVGGKERKDDGEERGRKEDEVLAGREGENGGKGGERSGMRKRRREEWQEEKEERKD